MSSLWLPSLAIIFGFAGLVWSADRFIEGSAALANNLGLSKLLIGLTIVSLGTSAPEVAVAISASLKDASELAIGNALGSNLANIGLVLGLTAIVANLPIRRYLLFIEIPVLIFVTIAAGWVLYDSIISFWEGLILVIGLIPLLWLIFKVQKYVSKIDEEIEITRLSKLSSIFWVICGLTVLIISSEILVWGGTAVAESFNVSPLIIGLTIIAIGTSLPELAASIMSVLKGHADIALGNVIGSNIFNILAVLSIPGILDSKPLSPDIFARDYFSMALMTLVLVTVIILDYALCKKSNKEHGTIGSKVGILLLILYLSYYYYLFEL